MSLRFYVMGDDPKEFNVRGMGDGHKPDVHVLCHEGWPHKCLGSMGHVTGTSQKYKFNVTRDGS